MYDLVSRTALVGSLGPFAPLVGGAFAGCASWLPVYPFDVIKTYIQNTQGGASSESIDSVIDRAAEEVSTYEAFQILKQEQGWGVFYDGITPKLLRASVNHAVTFFVFDFIMQRIA